MKIPCLLAAPIAFSFLVSCQPTSQPRNTVQPVVTQRPPAPSVPASSSSQRRTSTTPSSVSVPEPKIEPKTESLSKPDPLKSLQKEEVPSFDVPDNIKPKVSDGIDQGVFIELKW
ncbi:MAG: hypothetical protein Q7Q71_04525 [Verrucomicrobiota bacterium JB023]|nr:hypothetical protein [Verrucomicrobiota bacterium JB023]